jgi:cell division topological specificity factor
MARRMNVFLDLFRSRGSAPVARRRLQMLLAQERTAFGRFDLLAVLRDDILVAVARHVPVDDDNVHVTIDRDEATSRIEIEVAISHH